jgi:hypothetical protein
MIFSMLFSPSGCPKPTMIYRFILSDSLQAHISSSSRLMETNIFLEKMLGYE